MILNPNCSEVVLILPNMTIKKVIKELKEIGISVCKIPASEWYGWDRGSTTMREELCDIENPNIPDFTNHATLKVYSLDNGTIIEGNQHCQHQLFPTMKKIEDHFQDLYGSVDIDWYGEDGGDVGLYWEWIEVGMPDIEDFQDDEAKEKRRMFCKFEQT